MAAQPDSDYECPVCHELFTVPKLLPCFHLACKDCVRSWLDTGGGGGCPLCRAPILSPTPSGQGDLDSLVDALPTDLLTESLVKSHQVVTGPHVCAVCPGSVAATSYCFDCDVKLCATCSTQHRKIPASRDHVIHDLNTVTAKEVSARCRSSCQNHQGRPAQVYCSDHHELICWECAASRHRSCAEVKGLGDVAKEKRRELDRRIRGWRTKGAALVQQIQSRKEEFNKQRRYVKEAFDDIQRHAEKRRQQLYDIIQEQEDRDIDLEKTWVDVTSHTITMDHLRSGTDDVMLQMMNLFEPRSKEVDAECGRAENLKAVKDLQLNSQKITHIKSSLSALIGEEGAYHSVTARVTSPSPAASGLTYASAGTPVVIHTVPAVPPTSATATTTATTHHHTTSKTAVTSGSAVPNTTAVVARGSVVNPSPGAGTAAASTTSVPVTNHSASAPSPDTPVITPLSAAASVVTASLLTTGTTTTTAHTTSGFSIPYSSAASVTASVHAGETMGVASTSAVRTNITLPVTKDTTTSGGDGGAAAVTGAVLPGDRGSSPSAGFSPKPRRAALAKVLKVGDRVMFSSRIGLNLEDRRSGTVTAIPSARAVALYGKSAQGLVDVRWDEGEEVYCCMGYRGLYQLELL